MKKDLSFILIAIPALLLGCSFNNTSSPNNQQETEALIEELTEEISHLKEIIETQEERIHYLESFSYLQDFTIQELNAYELFLNDYDVTHLRDFSPEKIVLLYYQSIVDLDLEAIYAFTYDGDTLPEYPIFADQFYSSEHYQLTNNSIFTFRNYDSIQIREENQTDDHVNVEIDISNGAHQMIEIFELQKENNQWKLVLQHLL